MDSLIQIVTLVAGLIAIAAYIEDRLPAVKRLLKNVTGSGRGVGKKDSASDSTAEESPTDT